MIDVIAAISYQEHHTPLFDFSPAQVAKIQGNHSAAIKIQRFWRGKHPLSAKKSKKSKKQGRRKANKMSSSFYSNSSQSQPSSRQKPRFQAQFDSIQAEHENRAVSSQSRHDVYRKDTERFKKSYSSSVKRPSMQDIVKESDISSSEPSSDADSDVEALDNVSNADDSSTLPISPSIKQTSLQNIDRASMPPISIGSTPPPPPPPLPMELLSQTNQSFVDVSINSKISPIDNPDESKKILDPPVSISNHSELPLAPPPPGGCAPPPPPPPLPVEWLSPHFHEPTTHISGESDKRTQPSMINQVPIQPSEPHAIVDTEITSNSQLIAQDSRVLKSSNELNTIEDISVSSSNKDAYHISHSVDESKEPNQSQPDMQSSTHSLQTSVAEHESNETIDLPVSMLDIPSIETSSDLPQPPEYPPPNQVFGGIAEGVDENPSVKDAKSDTEPIQAQKSPEEAQQGKLLHHTMSRPTIRKVHRRAPSKIGPNNLSNLSGRLITLILCITPKLGFISANNCRLCSQFPFPIATQ